MLTINFINVNLIINVTVYLAMSQKQRKKILNWSNKTWCIQRLFWNWFLRFLFAPSALCHNITIPFCQVYIIFKMSLWPLNGIFWITRFQSIYSGRDSLPSFLNTSLVSSIFSLRAKWNTFFIRISLSL